VCIVANVATVAVNMSTDNNLYDCIVPDHVSTLELWSLSTDNRNFMHHGHHDFSQLIGRHKKDDETV